MNSHADRLVWRPAAIDHAQSDEGAPIPQASALDKRTVPGNRGFVEFQALDTDVSNIDEA
ncbi:hypothetical protein [Methylobacterium sp. J-090]|uniref:hypothetical protein n=1 Tax=Methylobacterium sp. J-090 TaxID=2836666 RepID=UPI001FB9007F|nr:hypothetical protein [Methylobacterium sp. J-090]MCJ2084128.1 hypothetical protein [Methylobacterium sp. J-090]